MTSQRVGITTLRFWQSSSIFFIYMYSLYCKSDTTLFWIKEIEKTIMETNIVGRTNKILKERKLRTKSTTDENWKWWRLSSLGEPPIDAWNRFDTIMPKQRKRKWLSTWLELHRSYVTPPPVRCYRDYIFNRIESSYIFNCIETITQKDLELPVRLLLIDLILISRII